MPCPLCEASHKPVVIINPLNNPFILRAREEMTMLKLKPEEVKTYNTYKPDFILVSYINRDKFIKISTQKIIKVKE